MKGVKGVKGALSDEEAALVRAWARRRRLAFWLLAPLGALVTLGAAAIGVLSLLDRAIFGVIYLLGAIAVPPLFYVLLWRPGRALAHVQAGHPTRVLRGTFTVRTTGRTTSVTIGGTPVEFVSRDVRRSVVVGEHCAVDVLHDSPALVIRRR